MYLVLLLFNVIFLSDLFIFTLEDNQRIIIYEYPVITYTNPKHIAKFEVTTRRISRSDPVYYMTMVVHTLTTIDQNLTTHNFIYEYVSNTYTHTFLQLHFKVCDYLDNEILGKSVKGAYLRTPRQERPTASFQCPLPPGIYRLPNFTVPNALIPSNIIFKKGRIYSNYTYNKEQYISGYINFEIKEKRGRKQKPRRIKNNF